MTLVPPATTDPDLRFLAHGGELGSAIAALDWAATPLGPIPGWPRSLRTAVALALRSPVAMALLWGIDGVMIYNDAYALIAGERHPQVLGSKVRESWPEIADFNDHVLRSALAGHSLTYRDQPLTLRRNGAPENCWFTLDYSPLLDDRDEPAGVIAIVVETTERMQAERWVNAGRERLQQMFAQSPGFMAMLVGPEHVFDLVNPAYLQLVGHRDVIGMRVIEALPEVEEQGFVALLDEVYRSGTAFSGMALPVNLQRSPGADQEQRFVDLVYQPVRDPAGDVIGIFVQGADVSDRVRAERAVQASEARNRQILDSAIDYAIIALDGEGRVTRWNEGAHRILGWTEAEMLGQSGECFFTPEDRAVGRMQSEMRSALVRGAGNDERWHLRKSGERFWANGEMTPIRNDEGEAIGFVKVLRDRTDQHRAAAALQQSEARLRRAQEAGGVGTFTLDLRTDRTSGTAEFFRIFGLAEQESLPAAVFEALVLPEDAHLRSQSITRDRQSAPLDVEYRIRRHSDQALRWIARKAEYETDEFGRAIRMVGVVQDVTERKAAQRALEASEAQFRTFAQTLPNHVWTAPPSGLLDWFNDRVYEYSGAPAGSLHGQGWAGIVHPDDLAVASRQWAEALSSGVDYETEFRIRRADGTYRWHLVRAVPLRAIDSTINRWVGTNTDIHERKLAEVQSARDRNRIWSLSQELMLICDFEGVIAAVNPAATRLLGFGEEEMIGTSVLDLVHPDDRERSASELHTLAGGTTTTGFECRARHRDGSYLLFDWTAVPDAGLIHSIGRNITGERAAEDALRQAQKMEAVGQLTGGIAHDFNNLLQGITGSLGLVQKRLAQGRVEDIDRFIANAMGSAKRAAALTHRLLAFSRRQPLDPRPVEVNPLVRSMDDLLRRTLGERIEFQMQLADELWLTKCDPNQLENAILNLAINSRDAMPDGGLLVIETGNTVLDAVFAARQQGVRPGRYVCISVTDTGTGMSADTRAKAFEPFFTTKPIGQGTGLGLSMIYGFAHQSEGFAKIYSEVGQGTTFKLYLPQFLGEADADEPLPQLSASHAAGADETVLVVEDEPVVRALIVEVLSELGYRALEAADGPAGLALLQSKQRIDLLITDIGLPGLNGRQIAEAGRGPRPGLKVLFMTGYAENAVLASGFLERGMSMITKPFAMEALATRVREIIEGN